MNKRIVFIDVARSFAILLALLDHSMNDFHVWANYPIHKFWIIKAITSSATPTFLFIFGMMIEIIYLKRLEKNGLDTLVPGLVKRSFQCYRGYALTAIAGVIGGIVSFNTMIAAFIFVGKTHFGNILKLYTIYMFLAIIILIIRRKFGINKLVIFTLCLWILYPLLQQIHIANYHISIFTSTFFAFGGEEGPSILYASNIVVLGMFSASFISTENRFRFTKANVILMTLFGLAVFVIAYVTGLQTFAENYFSNHYRYNSHPYYYICGIFLALVFTTIFNLLFPIGSYLKKWIEPFLIFGRQSLSAFTWGNVILNLIAVRIAQHHWNESGPIVFICVVFVLLQLKDRLENTESFTKHFKGVSEKWNSLVLKPISLKVIQLFTPLSK